MSFRPFLLLATLILFHGTATASTDDAEKRLQTAVNQVLAVAEHSSNANTLMSSIRPILEKYLSFDAMTRRAVGPGWRQFTADQQKKAIELFTTLIIRSYGSKFTPGEYPTITYKKATETASGRVEVPTNLLYKGSHYDVTYRMEQTEGWKITDVVIEGVSLVANYRSQFDAEVQKGGGGAVVTALTQAVDHPQ